MASKARNALAAVRVATRHLFASDRATMIRELVMPYITYNHTYSHAYNHTYSHTYGHIYGHIHSHFCRALGQGGGGGLLPVRLTVGEILSDG